MKRQSNLIMMQTSKIKWVKETNQKQKQRKIEKENIQQS